jgi:hypothetical protein
VITSPLGNLLALIDWLLAVSRPRQGEAMHAAERR